MERKRYVYALKQRTGLLTLLIRTGIEPSTPVVTYLSFPVMKASLRADLAIACTDRRHGCWLREAIAAFTHVLVTFSAMKEGSPLSVFRRPMTAASVPSSIASASVKAKSIYI